MTCLVLCGRQTEGESTAYWHIGDTQILHVLLIMAERQMRLHFLVCVFLFSLSLSPKSSRHRQTGVFGFPQPMVWSTKPLLMFSESGRTAPPLNTFPQNDGRRDAFCLRRAPSLLPVKVRAVIGRQNRVGVKSISGRGAQEINCGWRYRLWDEKRYMREINVPQSPLFSPSD